MPSCRGCVNGLPWGSRSKQMQGFVVKERWTLSILLYLLRVTVFLHRKNACITYLFVFFRFNPQTNNNKTTCKINRSAPIPIS